VREDSRGVVSSAGKGAEHLEQSGFDSSEINVRVAMAEKLELFNGGFENRTRLCPCFRLGEQEDVVRKIERSLLFGSKIPTAFIPDFRHEGGSLLGEHVNDAGGIFI
jgi:hypothetical protein